MVFLAPYPDPEDPLTSRRSQDYTITAYGAQIFPDAVLDSTPLLSGLAPLGCTCEGETLILQATCFLEHVVVGVQVEVACAARR